MIRGHLNRGAHARQEGVWLDGYGEFLSQCAGDSASAVGTPFPFLGTVSIPFLVPIASVVPSGSVSNSFLGAGCASFPFQ